MKKLLNGGKEYRTVEKTRLEHKEEKRLANQEAENNKLRTDF